MAAARASWGTRLKLCTVDWAENGYGAPTSVLVFYAFKMFFFASAWLFFISFNADVDVWWHPSSWFTKTALFKGLVWSMLFEILGLGCGSGPLTGRYKPPIAAPLYFLRLGSIRLPYFGGATRYTRSWFDIVLYMMQCMGCSWVLVGSEVDFGSTLFLCVNLLMIGVRDRTLYLSARPEHYLVMLACMLSTDHWFTGIVVVQCALWLWAAISKCTQHFPYVISVMCSNAPYRWLRPIRRRMYAQFPNDLRPSAMTKSVAHIGTMVEFGFPICLLFGGDGVILSVGLSLMVAFHLFILSQFPMGVPLEWNLMMIYGGFFCFGRLHSEVIGMPEPWLLTLLIVNSLALPLVGNFCPKAVSFLPSMRYYAGNWAYSVWLFRRGTFGRLKDSLKLPIDDPESQLENLYDEPTARGSMQSVVAFRHMHLHGRLLHELLPLSVASMEDYEYVDGEVVAGWLLGWNFGDGHLHDERLLTALQAKLELEAGSLRCVFVESQPLHRASLRWRIVDAKTGLVQSGESSVAELKQKQPWPLANAEGLAH